MILHRCQRWRLLTESCYNKHWGMKIIAEKAPQCNTEATWYLCFHYSINGRYRNWNYCTGKAAETEEERQSGCTFPWSDGAYQVIKEYSLRRVLSTGAYVTAAWAWSIAHHSTSFGTVNLPSDWAEIGGQQWQPSQRGRFKRHFTQSARIQRGVWIPNSHFHAE